MTTILAPIQGLYRPAVIAASEPRTVRHFTEFFTANIRNWNTRQAYGQPPMTLSVNTKIKSNPVRDLSEGAALPGDRSPRF